MSGLSAALNQGYSSGGSYGYNNGGSVNSGQSMSQSWANSGTDAMTARQWSMFMADQAWERDLQAMNMQMDFNKKEAQKSRDWEAEMANTIYTRSVKNMIEAGINPILAANMGLSGASVGSGATASLGGIPSAPVAQNFMDSWSASNSWSNGLSNGSSWNSGENSSWNHSESGLITALEAFGAMISSALEAVTSGSKIDFTLNGLENLIGNNSLVQGIKETAQNAKNNITSSVSKLFNKMTGHDETYRGGGGGHGFTVSNRRNVRGRYTR